MNREDRVLLIAAIQWIVVTLLGLGIAELIAVLCYVPPKPIYVEALPIESCVEQVVLETTELELPKILEEVSVEGIEDEIWDDSLEYLTMCVEAEAGNQTELGKRLVCDVVLNRFDSGKYDTLYDVINEEHNGVYQFSVVQDGRIFEVTPAEATYKIVTEELENRTNTEVLYFRTQHYHTFGTPLFQEDDHYFSK